LWLARFSAVLTRLRLLAVLIFPVLSVEGTRTGPAGLVMTVGRAWSRLDGLVKDDMGVDSVLLGGGLAEAGGRGD
jgi:hypothetical protein